MNEDKEYLDKLKNLDIFIRYLLKAEPTSQQSQAIAAINQTGAHVAIRSGHGTGKTAFVSWVILWALVTMENVKIPCTSPSAHQLFDVLWSEVRKWAKRLDYYLVLPSGKRINLYNEIEITSDKIYLRARPQDFAVARTARRENPEALQGFHSENILFVIDEASGVPDEIFQVAEGALSSRGARVLMTGNPTRTGGYFYDAFHGSRANWILFHWNSAESPMVDPEYVFRMRERYGYDSNVYRVRVLGEFPKAEEDQFFPLDIIESSCNKDNISTREPVIWGLDIARMGNDETILAKREGDEITELIRVPSETTMQVVGFVIDQFETAKNKPDYIVVDIVGIGAGVYDRLQEQRYPVVGVNAGESPSHKKKYANVRAELYGALKDWLVDYRGKLPRDNDLLAQLSSIKYKFDSMGRIHIEGKQEAKKRGVPSPDRVDAVALTFYMRPYMAAQNIGNEPRVIRDWEVF